jgi:hypothetical protein
MHENPHAFRRSWLRARNSFGLRNGTTVLVVLAALIAGVATTAITAYWGIH